MMLSHAMLATPPAPADVIVAGPAMAVAGAGGPAVSPSLFTAGAPGRLYRVILMRPDASGLLRPTISECSL